MATDPSRLRSPIHRETTPDIAAPRLEPEPERLPFRTRVAIVGALAITCWGFVLIAIGIIRSL